MDKDSEKVEPLSIKKLAPLFKLNFDKDDIKQLSESISEIGYQPIIVRHHKGDKYQLCSNPEIFEALKLLGKDTIDVIVRNITEQHGKELTLTSILFHTKLSSKSSEILVWTIYNSGGYKSHAEFGKIIGKSDVWVINKCYGKEQREKFFEPDVTSDCITTEMFSLIRPLPDDEQKLFFDRIQDGKIGGGEVRECYKFLKSCSIEHKKAILEGIVTYKEAKYVVEKRFGRIEVLLDKVKRKLKEKRTLQDAVQEERIVYSAEIIRKLADIIKELHSTYICNIPDETERKQADSDIDFCIALLDRIRLKRERITPKKYHERIEELGLSPEIVEHLKEDGHSLFFESEYQTPKEEELTEKIRKVDKTKGDLLRVLA